MILFKELRDWMVHEYLIGGNDPEDMAEMFKQCLLDLDPVRVAELYTDIFTTDAKAHAVLAEMAVKLGKRGDELLQEVQKRVIQ